MIDIKAKEIYKREHSNSELIKRFLPYFRPYIKTMVFDLLCALLTTLCDLVLPMIVRRITAFAIDDISSLTVAFILKTGVFYIVLRFIDAAANYYMSYTGHIMGTKIETDMRKDLFDHLLQLSFSYYDKMKIGQIMARITSDLFDITEFAHHCPEEFFIAGIKIAVTFCVLCSVNVWLTLIIFASLPLMILFTIGFRFRMRKAFFDQRHELGEINSQVEDSLLGIRVVRSFANEGVEAERFAKGNMRFFRAKKNAYKHMAGFHSTTRVFDGVMYILVVIVGALFIVKEKITAADYTAYLLYVAMLLAGVRRIVEFTEQFERGMTGVERFCQIIDAPVEINDNPLSEPVDSVKGEIEFRDVSFSYSKEKGDVIHNLNLTVHAGENVALVGPSGGGKTTLCSLIPRFYDIAEGKIFIDGKDVHNLTLQSLRSSIGVVQQDVYLFSGTVRSNILYGKADATDLEIVEAAKLAGAHEFIMKLPQQYETYVGERGVMLSGGQKQRISIARVFLKNPPILILDEATSALDNENEMIVQRSLSVLAKGRTTVTVAHRLTTVKGADRIIVLTENGIAEQGSHDELLKKGGEYSHLYNLYTSIK